MDGLNPTAEGIQPGGRPNSAELTPRQRRIVLAMLWGLLGFIVTLEPTYGYFVGPEWLNWNTIYVGCLLLALPGLLAVWAALSPEPLAIRLPRALGLAAVLGLLATWTATLTEASNGPADTTAQIAFFPMIVLVLTALLTIVRRRYGWRIVATTHAAAPSAGGSQFSLKQMLVWIACTAVVLGLARWMASDGSDESTDWMEMLTFLPFLVTLPILCLPLLIPCVGFSLSESGRRRFAVWTAVMLATVAGLLFVAMFALLYLGNGPVQGAEIGSLAIMTAAETGGFEIGFLVTLLACLTVFRFCGYRLTRGKAAPAPIGDPTTAPCEPPQQPAPAQPWWQSPFPYLVGTILLLVLALCWPAWRIHLGRQQAYADSVAMQEFRQIGVETIIYHGRLMSITLPSNKPIDETVLRRLSEFGERANIDSLDLSNRPMTDDQMRYLRGLTCLQHLNLAGTGISDAGLAHLANFKQLAFLNLTQDPITDESMKILREFPNLQVLTLANTQVTDAGVADLQGLKQLQALNLSGTPITDAAIEPLKTMKQLQELGLDNTQMTVRGRSELTRTLPQLRCNVSTSEATPTPSPSQSPPTQR